MESPNSPNTVGQVQTTTATPVAVQQDKVVIPVPVVQPVEGNYVYCFVKGSLYANFTSLFGLANEEIQALSKRYNNTTTIVDNGIMIKAPPAELINSLSQIGYKVVCSTGEAEVTWTLQRDY